MNITAEGVTDVRHAVARARAFRMTPAGLIVPESTRPREVITNEERRTLQRASKILERHSVAQAHVCQQCQELMVRESTVSGFELRCQCRALVFVKGV